MTPFLTVCSYLLKDTKTHNVTCPSVIKTRPSVIKTRPSEVSQALCLLDCPSPLVPSSQVRPKHFASSLTPHYYVLLRQEK